MPGDLGEDTKPDVKSVDLFTNIKDEPKSESNYSAGYDNNSDITSLETVKQEYKAVVEIDHVEGEGENSYTITVHMHLLLLVC